MITPLLPCIDQNDRTERITTFMLLLVNNVEKKMRRRVTKTISFTIYSF